jgi:hypothetical protein
MDVSIISNLSVNCVNQDVLLLFVVTRRRAINKSEYQSETPSQLKIHMTTGVRSGRNAIIIGFKSAPHSYTAALPKETQEMIERLLAEIRADRKADREELQDMKRANREDLKSSQAEMRSIVSAWMTYKEWPRKDEGLTISNGGQYKENAAKSRRGDRSAAAGDS